MDTVLLGQTKRRAILIILTLVITWLGLRVYLHLFPATNLYIASYNIHHLFSGILLMVVGGIPAVLWSGCSRYLDVAIICFAAGLAMVLDEWVYLIVTDGSDRAYLQPLSFWGALVMLTVVLAYIIFLYQLVRRSKSR